MIRVVSFDVDETLVDRSFADSVWFEEIPKLYAERHGVSFAKALELLKREYDRVGPERLEWYDIKYWFNRFSLGKGWTELLERCGERVHPYPEAVRVLEGLSKSYELVVASGSAREFLDVNLAQSNLRPYFTRVFSSVSDYGMIKKKPEFFERVCESLGVTPAQLLHVGDDPFFDFEAPRKLGVRSVLLDRSRRRSGKWVIHDLREVEKFLV